MALRAMGLHPGLGHADVSLAIGDMSQRGGSAPTDIAMDLEGALGIAARPFYTFRPLQSLIEGRNDKTLGSLLWGLPSSSLYVLVRRCPPGEERRWVLCDTAPAEEEEGVRLVSLIDPVLGERILVPEAELRPERAREMEGGILIPSLPSAHKAHAKALEPAEVTSAHRGAPPHWTPLVEWCGARRITPPSAFSFFHKAFIEREPGEIRDAFQRAESLEELPWRSPRLPEARFCIPRDKEGRAVGRLVATNDEKTVLFGGISGGMTWIEPEYRGNGLAAEMLIAATSTPNPVMLGPTEFSVEGYRARLSAHRRALEDAIRAGEDIPAAVLADYDVNPETGRASLRDPAWEEAWRAAEAEGRHTFAPGSRVQTMPFRATLRYGADLDYRSPHLKDGSSSLCRRGERESRPPRAIDHESGDDIWDAHDLPPCGDPGCVGCTDCDDAFEEMYGDFDPAYPEGEDGRSPSTGRFASYDPRFDDILGEGGVGDPEDWRQGDLFRPRR